MPANPLIFKDAEKARDALLVSQKKEIAALYQQWADEIGERADYYAHKSTASSAVSERQMRELQKMMEETSKQVANEVYNDITRNLYTVADSVVRCNNEWLASLGFNPGTVNAIFNYVPDDIVRNIVSGQIYDSGWSLSSRIWSDNEDTMKQAYQIVAGGVAQNKPMYEIAKDLEKYVSPSAVKPWNLRAPDGKKIYPKDVDYNAQRLGRTLVQHGYQQSFVATTQKNPFITDYIWIANGSRVCEICSDRNGRHYPKDDLPLDHPNGMCTMVPDVVEDLTGQLADWFNSEDGTYPEIDEFSKNFGYTPLQAAKSGATKTILGSPTEVSKAEFDRWTKSLSSSEWDEILANDPLYTSTDHFGPHYKEALGRHFIATNYPEGSTIRGMSLDGTRLTPRQKAVAFFNEKMQPFKDAVSGVNSKALGTGAPSWTTWRETMKGQTREMLDAEDIKRLNKMGGTAKKSLYSYTTDQFVEINGFMRESATRGFDNVADALKASKANDKHLKHIENIVEGFEKAPGLPTDRVLCRGSDIGELAGLFGTDDFATNLAKLNTMNVDQLNDALSGAVGRYTGFTSTGGLYGSGFNVGGSETISALSKMGDVGSVEYYIYAPQGTKAVSVTSLSKFGTFGDEVLLDAGTTVKFQHATIEDSTGVAGDKKRVAVFLEIIGQ